ncbi:hypothetical protein MPL3365_290063 [Mesorhizobium plurifarium]|uniref:Uncharacterized protein n=1 Tax=Mesorhizobium plurifarium TaxID=69974 RepID=A0A090GDD5_MESPL|nr:hypothetical protein MPL3365_290063 [Mesorhizobium plurifarium]
MEIFEKLEALIDAPGAETVNEARSMLRQFVSVVTADAIHQFLLDLMTLVFVVDAAPQIITRRCASSSRSGWQCSRCLAKPRREHRPGKPVAWRKRYQPDGETAEYPSRLHVEWRVPRIRCSSPVGSNWMLKRLETLLSLECQPQGDGLAIA